MLKQDIQEEENEDEEVSAINLNHVDPALQFYSKHTAQIEVIFFRILYGCIIYLPLYSTLNIHKYVNLN